MSEIMSAEWRKKISESVKRAHAEGRMNTSFAGRQGWSKDKKLPARKRSVENVLVKNSKYGTNVAKLVIIRDGLLPYRCANLECAIDNWRGNKLRLHLHHKNGVRRDHRLENLEFLCPNCHDLKTTIWKKTT